MANDDDDDGDDDDDNCISPFPNDKFQTLPKSLQTTVLRLMKMMESSPNG